jgi:hypothetical protein
MMDGIHSLTLAATKGGRPNCGIQDEELNPGAFANRTKLAARGAVVDPHQPASAGKTLANFTLVRGAAIIGATASRQRW